MSTRSSKARPIRARRRLPPATLANGLPGATNFVPNNVDPVRTTGAIGRYFDVTLSANGTTTLDSTVTIDRFTLAGAGARLNIDFDRVAHQPDQCHADHRHDGSQWAFDHPG